MRYRGFLVCEIYLDRVVGEEFGESLELGKPCATITRLAESIDPVER